MVSTLDNNLDASISIRRENKISSNINLDREKSSDVSRIKDQTRLRYNLKNPFHQMIENPSELHERQKIKRHHENKLQLQALKPTSTKKKGTLDFVQKKSYLKVIGWDIKTTLPIQNQIHLKQNKRENSERPSPPSHCITCERHSNEKFYHDNLKHFLSAMCACPSHLFIVQNSPPLVLHASLKNTKHHTLFEIFVDAGTNYLQIQSTLRQFKCVNKDERENHMQKSKKTNSAVFNAFLGAIELWVDLYQTSVFALQNQLIHFTLVNLGIHVKRLHDEIKLLSSILTCILQKFKYNDKEWCVLTLDELAQYYACAELNKNLSNKTISVNVTGYYADLPSIVTARFGRKFVQNQAEFLIIKDLFERSFKPFLNSLSSLVFRGYRLNQSEKTNSLENSVQYIHKVVHQNQYHETQQRDEDMTIEGFNENEIHIPSFLKGINVFVHRIRFNLQLINASDTILHQSIISQGCILSFTVNESKVKDLIQMFEKVWSKIKKVNNEILAKSRCCTLLKKNVLKEKITHRAIDDEKEINLKSIDLINETKKNPNISEFDESEKPEDVDEIENIKTIDENKIKQTVSKILKKQYALLSERQNKRILAVEWTYNNAQRLNRATSEIADIYNKENKEFEALVKQKQSKSHSNVKGDKNYQNQKNNNLSPEDFKIVERRVDGGSDSEKTCGDINARFEKFNNKFPIAEDSNHILYERGEKINKAKDCLISNHLIPLSPSSPESYDNAFLSSTTVKLPCTNKCDNLKKTKAQKLNGDNKIDYYEPTQLVNNHCLQEKNDLVNVSPNVVTDEFLNSSHKESHPMLSMFHATIEEDWWEKNQHEKDFKSIMANIFTHESHSLQGEEKTSSPKKLIPLQIALKLCLYNPMKTQCELLERLMLNYMFHGAQIINHLFYLRQTMLGMGGYLQCFSSNLYQTLVLDGVYDRNNDSSIALLIRNAHLKSITSIGISHDNCSFLEIFLHQSLLQHFNTMSKDSYSLPKLPMAIGFIIDCVAMTKYRKIQSFLLKHLQMELLVKDIWSTSIEVSKKSSLDCRFSNSFHLYHYSLNHKVSMISQYIRIKLQTSWQKIYREFRLKPNDTVIKNVQDFYILHQRDLELLCISFFLENGSVSEQITTFFDELYSCLNSLHEKFSHFLAKKKIDRNFYECFSNTEEKKQYEQMLKNFKTYLELSERQNYDKILSTCCNELHSLLFS